MNMPPTQVQWERFELMPDGAVWDPATATVWVADIHLGKGATYRRLGMPVPSGTTAANLLRLDVLLADTAAEHLVILGDLVHSRLGTGIDLIDRVAAWRAGHPQLRITLVEGNHDARSGPMPAAWRIDTVSDATVIAAVECRHYPPPLRDAKRQSFCFAGHLHPSVALYGPGRDRLRVPCFFARGNLLLLPAFGEFTGGADVRDLKLGRPTALFALAGQHVVPIELSPAIN